MRNSHDNFSIVEQRTSHSNDNATMAVIKGGLGGPWPLPDFWLAPCLTPHFFA